jgi:hypothetical protein
MKRRRHEKSLSNQIFLTINLVAVFSVIFSLSCVSASSSSKRVVGGSCAYKQYSGEAEIISVSRKSDNSGSYEVKFSFHPRKAVREEFARDVSRQWSFVMKDFSDPREDYVKQYGMKPGKRFPCFMKVITKGTCTPVMFDFPTIEGAH